MHHRWIVIQQYLLPARMNDLIRLFHHLPLLLRLHRRRMDTHHLLLRLHHPTPTTHTRMRHTQRHILVHIYRRIISHRQVDCIRRTRVHSHPLSVPISPQSQHMHPRMINIPHQRRHPNLCYLIPHHIQYVLHQIVGPRPRQLFLVHLLDQRPALVLPDVHRKNRLRSIPQTQEDHISLPLRRANLGYFRLNVLLHERPSALPGRVIPALLVAAVIIIIIIRGVIRRVIKVGVIPRR
mmetsp:Transcript_10108/g.27534  ORF Transcript_10108/g.27534 Transcript_10108/m.27534 type:complete len:237 (+) Transcript_10108:2157-2867(+)